MIAACALAGLGRESDSKKTDWEALGKRWWAHVQYLSDDKLEGRDTGSKGFEKAAEYVLRQFREAGLRPAGTRGYVHPVGFVARQIDEAHSSLELVREGKVERITLGEEAFFDLGSDPAPIVEAPMVFVGYGLSVPELGYDDFAGLDLRGKIAVLVTGGPAKMPGPIKAYYQTGEERWKALNKAGVVGVARIQNPKAIEVPWSRTSASRLQPEMELADPALREADGERIALRINPERAEKFFEGSGHTFAEIEAAVKADQPLPRFPLAKAVRARIGVKRWRVASKNIAGILPGSDEMLGKEYVVLTAHLDHVGVGEPVNGDRIYNGAMDDASGIASLLEIARAMRDAGAKPRRSILFLAVTGEEKGLLGSKYFAARPTVDGRNIVADLNMDMFLPLFPLKWLEVQGLGESTLGDDVREVAAQAGVQVQADKEPDRNRFIRSDQYSFIRRGVPALAFKFGYLPGDPEEKIFRAWYHDRYHAPSDDARQSVDAAAAAQFNNILEKLALRVADAPERPRWKPDSFFRRFAQ
jgi:Zn-dependent M28 family amino/carboxypeptidase